MKQLNVAAQIEAILMFDLVVKIRRDKPDLYNNAEVSKVIAPTKQVLLSLIEQVGKEIIGNGKNDSVHNYDAHVEREILRAAQRQRLQDLLKGGKK